MSLSVYDAPTGSYTSAIPPGTAAFRKVLAEVFGFTRTEVIRDQSRCAQHGSEHCLAGETLVLTQAGPVPISKLTDSSEIVLTRKPHEGGGGFWIEAEFRSFGIQPLMRITLRRGAETKIIRATPQHRWFVLKPRPRVNERATSQLQQGDRLATCFPSHNNTLVIPSPLGILHGLVFGDGDGRGNINLYGEKNQQLAKWFPADQPHSVHRGDVLQYRGLPGAWRYDVPSLDENTSYLYGWLAGYFAADGTVGPEGALRIASVNPWRLEAVEKIALRLGIITYPMRSFVKGEQAFGPGGRIYVLGISGRTLSPEFFLIAQHLERWL